MVLQLPKSRELRAALAAGAAAACVAALLGVGCYLMLEQYAIEHVDQLLRSHASTVFATPGRPLPWDILEPEMELSYAQPDRPAICIFWGRTDSAQYYRSKTWPMEFDPRALLPNLKLPDTWTKNRRSARTASRSSDSQDNADSMAPGGGAGYVSDLEEEGIDHALTPVRIASTTVDGRTWRLAAFTFDGDAIVLGRNMRPVYAALGPSRNLLIAVCPLAFLLVFVATFFAARRKEDGMARIALLLDKISADTLTRRLTVAECGTDNEALVKAFNEMMDRFEWSFEDARRFSGLAAHELKTPLAILQGKLDLAIHEQLPGSPWQRFLAELLEDVARLKGVTEKLLLLSRADAGRLELNIVEVNLTDLLEQHIQDTELLASELKMDNHLPDNITVQGDKTLLNVLFQNLFANAIKHNSGGDGAFINIDLRKIPNGIRLAVSNSARPIPPELHQRIFSRFGRGTAPKESVEGAGLGLSLAYEIARVHGGRLKLKESTHEQTTFVLKLRSVPLPPPNVSTNWRLLKRIEPLSSHPV